MKVKAIDFFCGAGGLTRGFLDAGIQVICGIDDDGAARKTYEENNRIGDNSVPFVREDLAQYSVNKLLDYLPTDINGRNHKLIFATCPPCQIFSKVNTLKAKREKEKDLLLKFGEFVKAYLPDYVFVENVPGIRKEKYGNILQQFLHTLAELDYESEWQLINAKDYGIPQNRLRIVVLAALRAKIGFPPKACTDGDFRTVESTIKKYPRIGAGKKHPTIQNHQAAGLSSKNLRRISLTPKNGGSRLAWADRDELKLKCYNNHHGHTDVYGRMTWKEVSPALTTRFNSFSNGRFGHPTQNRAISLREGAALQTFGDDYVFFGNATQIAKHIGNAFPVELGRVFGHWIIRHARTLT